MGCTGQMWKNNFVYFEQRKSSNAEEKEHEQQIYRKAKHCSSTRVDRRPWSGLGLVFYNCASCSDVRGGTDSDRDRGVVLKGHSRDLDRFGGGRANVTGRVDGNTILVDSVSSVKKG